MVITGHQGLFYHLCWIITMAFLLPPLSAFSHSQHCGQYHPVSQVRAYLCLKASRVLPLKILVADLQICPWHCSDFVHLFSHSSPLPLLPPYGTNLPPWLLTLIFLSARSLSTSRSSLFQNGILSHSLISSWLYFQLPFLLFVIHFIYFNTFYFGKCKRNPR